MELRLIKEIRKGDVKSFEKLFSMYYNVLFAYSLRFINDREEAKEIVNDSFIKFWENRKQIKAHVDSVKPYLFQIVHNLSINYLKKRSNQNTVTVPDFFFLEETLKETPPQMDCTELNLRIRKAIDKLPPKRKEIFMLSRFSELKYSEIAAELNISIKTVENQISRALHFLRSELKDEF